MFAIKLDNDANGDLLDDKTYVQHESLRIRSLSIVCHIENQVSFFRDCYERLGDADHKEIIKSIAMYAMMLVASFQIVKAERDNDDHASERDAPLVLPVQLVTLRHGTFLKQVFDPFQQHISLFWSETAIEQIEAERRKLLNLYTSDIVLRGIIDEHDVTTLFNDAWKCALDHFERMRLFCGGLAFVLANTTKIPF